MTKAIAKKFEDIMEKEKDIAASSSVQTDEQSEQDNKRNKVDGDDEVEGAISHKIT